MPCSDYKIVVPPRMFMCRHQWYMLPKSMRDEVWEHYVPGQEVRKDPTLAYVQHAQRCIELGRYRRRWRLDGKCPGLSPGVGEMSARFSQLVTVLVSSMGRRPVKTARLRGWANANRCPFDAGRGGQTHEETK